MFNKIKIILILKKYHFYFLNLILKIKSNNVFFDCILSVQLIFNSFKIFIKTIKYRKYIYN
ncbi:hypothetical protein AMC77_00025 [Candidatus Profftella armatura]|uniref:Uncharacterized protein n=1 Tax=Candidatus Profftella armatura TaxID=669502 RepID=S5R7X8_9PROT|nr:hypothetical protein SSDC_00025 [Candidatus Profftella armatura]ALC95825.1 hypothetical protein AMC77_00025 [Candidatus Profftella armatura]